MCTFDVEQYDAILMDSKTKHEYCISCVSISDCMRCILVCTEHICLAICRLRLQRPLKLGSHMDDIPFIPTRKCLNTNSISQQTSCNNTKMARQTFHYLLVFLLHLSVALAACKFSTKTMYSAPLTICPP